jgi:hypothetical protein
VLSRSASANAYTFSSYLKRLQDSVAFIPGYEPYISSTADGKNEVSGETVMNGEYYVCYKRNSQAEITIVCKCDNSFMHDNEFRCWNADYTNSRLLGTYGKFYLDVGSTELKKMLNYMNENTHGLWVEGAEGAEHNIPKVKYYSDSACTKEITDFSVNGDMTIYVKIVG